MPLQLETLAHYLLDFDANIDFVPVSVLLNSVMQFDGLE